VVFLIQPYPFLEKLILAEPEVYLKKKIGYGIAGLTPFTSQAYNAYLSYIRNEETVHGMCEDYRAAATIDLEHDKNDAATITIFLNINYIIYTLHKTKTQRAGYE
jgi:haloacetate dehalogenase